MNSMSFEWDERKAEANYKKHGVRFSESLSVLRTIYAITDHAFDSHGTALRVDWFGREGPGAGRSV